MESRVKNREMFCKCLAAISVFAVCFLSPVIIWKIMVKGAHNSVVMTEMGALKNWAEVYELKNGSYEGLEINEDVKKVISYIEEQGGSCSVFENRQDYCAVATFNGGGKQWCIDSNGYDGSGGTCSGESVKCH